METNKKNGSIVAIVILAILVVALGGYIGYDKFLNNNNTSTTEENSKNETNTKNEIEDSETYKYKALLINNDNCMNCSNEYGKMKYELASGFYKSYQARISNEESTQISYATNTDTTSHTISFDKKIQDILVGTIGNDWDSEIIFTLMEDGTVEYIKWYENKLNNNIVSTKLNDVKDIIKLYLVTANPEGSQYGDGMTVLAQKSDGSFYDLQYIIFKQQ